jgi:hypothetical protein
MTGTAVVANLNHSSKDNEENFPQDAEREQATDSPELTLPL